MMFKLGIRGEFSANHYLIGGDWGEENREHSHNYQLEIILQKSELDQHGYLIDIVEVTHHLDGVVEQFAGKTLNALPAFANLNPSIEHFATILFQLFRQRFAKHQLHSLTVVLSEDEVAWTSYTAPL
jgi:6-pyruvoyltetrahydropterin/6-carboxytetrahydropterin synthase